MNMFISLSHSMCMCRIRLKKDPSPRCVCYLLGFPSYLRLTEDLHEPTKQSFYFKTSSPFTILISRRGKSFSVSLTQPRTLPEVSDEGADQTG